jgi:hypothetical protein
MLSQHEAVLAQATRQPVHLAGPNNLSSAVYAVRDFS